MSFYYEATTRKGCFSPGNEVLRHNAFLENFGRRLRHGPGKQPHTWLANAGAAAAFRWAGRPAPSLMQSRRVALCTFVGRPLKKSTCATGQTSKPFSARRSPYAGHTVAIRRNGERKNNEMPDYFVFVAWACRLLLHWSLCQRQW